MGKQKKAKLVQLLKKFTAPVAKNQKKPLSKHSFQFEADDSVLLVGEGNFSFAASLMEELSGSIALTATCFDSADVVNSKYPDAHEFIAELADWEATVHYNVDATKLQSVKALRGKRFTKILFNFPHVGGGIKDQDRNVRQNQALIGGILVFGTWVYEQHQGLWRFKEWSPIRDDQIWNAIRVMGRQGTCQGQQPS
ncbi:hypothetical protein BASA60_004751 [Batrachochytrium salamandrivorans]|nr:hypothetical protein BASA60_004751 [Batrachochytrium salamandrivorans]